MLTWLRSSSTSSAHRAPPRNTRCCCQSGQPTLAFTIPPWPLCIRTVALHGTLEPSPAGFAATRLSTVSVRDWRLAHHSDLGHMSTISLPSRFALIAFATVVRLAAPAGEAVAQEPNFARRLMSDSGTIRGATVSPDGRWIAFTRPSQPQLSGIWIRPIGGGESRRLVDGVGTPVQPQFSPKGDFLLFAATRPRSGTDDDGYYLMSARFDASSGALVDDPRRVAPDRIALAYPARPAISPDGSRVAYITCCTSSGGSLRVTAITGGTSQTLLTHPGNPAFPSWDSTGTHILYQVRERRSLTRYRVSASGGEPEFMVAQDSSPIGRSLPGSNRFVAIVGEGASRFPGLRFLDERGQRLGGVLELPWAKSMSEFSAAPTGRDVIVVAEDATTAVRIASTSPGPLRDVTTSSADEWPIGWSKDSRTVFVYSQVDGKSLYRGISRDGREIISLPMPEGLFAEAFVQDASLIERHGWGFNGADVTYERLDLGSGARRLLARGVRDKGCCLAPGGPNQASYGADFFYTSRRDTVLEVRAWRADGSDRLVTTLGTSTLGIPKAVFGDRVAYAVPAGDSALLFVKAGFQPPMRLGAFSSAAPPSEYVWSYDGMQLAVAIGAAGREVRVFRLDASGLPQGEPAVFALPVASQFQMQWLPDGSGVTMVASLRPDSPRTDVVLMKFTKDVQLSVLTADDSTFKPIHALSPDGALVAYPSMTVRGNSVWLIDVEKALAYVRRQP